MLTKRLIDESELSISKNILSPSIDQGGDFITDLKRKFSILFQKWRRSCNV